MGITLSLLQIRLRPPTTIATDVSPSSKMPTQGRINPSERIKVRVRSQRACAPCRKRKIKCDGNDPCAACVGYGYDCLYIDRTNTRPTSSNVAAASPSQSQTGSHDTRPSDPVIPPVKIDQQFMGQESLVLEPNGESQLLRGMKTRFTSGYSAVACPKRLAMSLGMVNPPRLQAFGWNPGTRVEQNHVPPGIICDIVSLEEMNHLAGVYFKEVHPFFGFLDPEMFMARTKEFWAARQRGTDFEACMCTVFALGSYFSGNSPPSHAESQVVEHGRLLLDMSSVHPPAMVSVKHVVAWTLRALYLRLTTRPHLSWMASCTAVHLAESIGLHREITEIQIPRSITSQEVELRRRTFWVTMAIHQYFASEYGRSRIVLESTACHQITPAGDNDLTAETLAILQSVPDSNYLGHMPELLLALSKATTHAAQSPFLALLRADACFCIFRMLASTNSRLQPEQVLSLLEVIRVALDAVAFTCSMTLAWWNVVGTPFHSVCVLISIGTRESLELIPIAMETLKNVTTKYPCHLSDEAFRTAHVLVRGARDKRSVEMDSLDLGLQVAGEVLSPPNTIFDAPLNFDFPVESDQGFQDFLDLTNYYGLDSTFGVT